VTGAAGVRNGFMGERHTDDQNCLLGISILGDFFTGNQKKSGIISAFCDSAGQ